MIQAMRQHDVASPFQAMRLARTSSASPILRPGTMHDYHALARFHYRATRPATIARILTLDDPLIGEPVGVLVLSMPTLNGRWRDEAWPGRFRARDRSAAAARINRELRTISRVIIDPRYRGLGLAARLVRAYLSNPDTPATEAIAAMGVCSPFFAAAGMTPYTLPLRRPDHRLHNALAAAGLTPLLLLRAATNCARAEHASTPSAFPSDPLSLWERVAAQRPGEGTNAKCHCSQPPWAVASVLRALRTWANDSRATRHLLSAPADSLARAAAMALLSRPIAYAHGHADLTPVPQAPLDPTRGPHARTAEATPNRNAEAR